MTSYCHAFLNMKYLILPCKVHAVVESIQAIFFYYFYAFVL